MGVTWAFFQERAEWRVNLEGHRKQKSGSSCLPFCHLVSQQGPPFPEPLVLFTGVGEE